MFLHKCFYEIYVILLLAIFKFSESEQLGISDYERCYPCPCFEEPSRDQSDTSPHKTPLLIGPLIQGNIRLEPISKYFSQRNLLKLVVPVSFLSVLIQDNLR